MGFEIDGQGGSNTAFQALQDIARRRESSFPAMDLEAVVNRMSASEDIAASPRSTGFEVDAVSLRPPHAKVVDPRFRTGGH